MRRHAIGWTSTVAMVAIIGCGGGGGHGSSSATDAEPTIPRANASQTVRPTRTPVAGFPTPTAGGLWTPTGTPAGTHLPGTTTATPRPTILSQGVVRIEPAYGDPGESVALAVRLTDIAPGLSIVATQNDIYFDASQVTIAVTTEGRPDCVVNPAINKEYSQFAFFPSRCVTGSCNGIRALVLSLTNLDPIPSGSVLYTCNASISPTAHRESRSSLVCAVAKGSDPNGGEVGVACPDSWIDIADSPPLSQAIVDIGSIQGAPGESVALEVSLTNVTPGSAIVATQNDLHFDPTQLTFAGTASGKPDCAVNPAIGKEATSFSFQPPGCFADDSCTGIRALVLSYEDLSAIPSGSLLYTCNVSIAASAEVGASDLLCSMALGSDAAGHAIPVDCPPAQIEVVLDNLPSP